MDSVKAFFLPKRGWEACPQSGKGRAIAKRRRASGFPVPRNLVRRGGQANVIIDNEMFLSLKWDSDEQGSYRVRGG
jgi:hypothetical protein